MKDRGLERVEAGDLRRAIREIEALLAASTALTGSANTMVLGHLLDKAKNRIVELDRAEADSIAEEREKSLKEVAVAVMAEREAALNAEERRQFGEFLKKEHFTKADFGSLEQFYRSAWDRLSEDGKAEMSHRIWEGVRRKEYEFSELPDIVKEKEAQRLRDQLDRTQIPSDLQRIPERDRADFTRAWDSGERNQAYEVLDRPVFAENVALKPSAVRSENVEANKAAAQPTAEKEAVLAKENKLPSPERLMEDYDLKDLKLVDTPDAKPPAPAITEGKISPAPTVRR